MLSEPNFKVQTGDGLRTLKPDLVIVTGDEVVVVDVSIVTENTRFRHQAETSTLAGAWDIKRSYYAHPDLTNQLTKTFKKTSVSYGALIISLRGI